MGQITLSEYLVALNRSQDSGDHRDRRFNLTNRLGE